MRHSRTDIGVVDVNENAPVFVTPTPNAIDISEDTLFGARLFTVSTNDVDGGLGGISVFTLKDSYGDTFNITRARCANNQCSASVHLTGTNEEALSTLIAFISQESSITTVAALTH